MTWPDVAGCALVAVVLANLFWAIAWPNAKMSAADALARRVNARKGPPADWTVPMRTETKIGAKIDSTLTVRDERPSKAQEEAARESS